MKTIVFILICIIFTFYIAFSSKLSKENVCASNIVFEKSNSTKVFRAILYQFDCGAMSSFSTQVSIVLPEEKLIVDQGNVFSAERGEQRGSWGGPYAEVEWINEKKLLIRYVKSAKIFQKQYKVHDVEIVYETLPDIVDEKTKMEAEKSKKALKTIGIELAK